MLICNQCKKEMVCVHTGVTVRWRKSYARSGDTFQCLKCDVQITLAAEVGYEDKTEVGPGTYIEMED